MSDVRPVLPLFPLPEFFLFPGTAVPLHVFEPRYRRMIDDMLDGPGRLVMGTVMPEHAGQLSGVPPVQPVGGLGEIVRHRPLDDGRYLILVAGLARVRIEEVPSPHPYRQAAIVIQEDVAMMPQEAQELAPRLRDALARWRVGEEKFDESVGAAALADVLLHQLRLDAAQMARLYAESSQALRAREALRQEARLRGSSAPE